MNYYNEHDPKAAAWLRELIKAGYLPAGIVDERSITEVSAQELGGYTQCHFFAGIGGWPLSLQLAGWPADKPVWTGSCPCQPFSCAGKGLGEKDDRHLWPAFFDLIRQRCPEHVFGEQVASAIGHGWLDGISADLEAEDYTCGAVVLGAHSVGSPNLRQRLYWVANAKLQHEQPAGQYPKGKDDFAGMCEACGLVLANGNGFSQGSFATTSTGHGHTTEPAGFWSDYELIPCRDGKTRRIPTEPAFFPLAHGLPARVVRLRGYGNAIVPQVAAEFIMAYTDLIEA